MTTNDFWRLTGKFVLPCLFMLGRGRGIVIVEDTADIASLYGGLGTPEVTVAR